MRFRVELVAIFVALLGCGTGEEACTELGCENKTNVVYSSPVPAGAYMLSLTAEGQSASFNCGTSAMGTGDGGGGDDSAVTCDSRGFELVGHPFADRRSFFVTVQTEDGDTPIDNVEVQLSTVDTLQPNGEDCEPSCFVRSGTVL